MVQGTTSDAGKSTLVTALCRLLYRHGVRVAPFKPQNIALNSAVTENGGEIGRAQALQAQAAGLVPHTDMNPILMKPDGDRLAQIVINGHAIGRYGAGQSHAYRQRAHDAIFQAHERLTANYDLILAEGTGSPAEINLPDGDIANMGFADAVDCPVILIADIDKGGVFAHIVGTLALLSPSQQARIKGFVINRFRGDISLLQPGLKWLEQYTGTPVLGVLPHLDGLYLDAEDRLLHATPTRTDAAITVVVPQLPYISNHTDLDPLRWHPQVDLHLVEPCEVPPPADLIILPGSKSVAHDLNLLLTHGWRSHLQRHLRYGGKLLGICGGFQMLGQHIRDPLAMESDNADVSGFGLLDMVTELKADKQLHQRRGRLHLNGLQVPVEGYEIHTGISTGTALHCPLLQFADHVDGAVSEDDQIAGSYLHGLFERPQALSALLEWSGLAQAKSMDGGSLREASIERLADCVAQHLDMEQLRRLAGLPPHVTDRKSPSDSPISSTSC